ncbi:MULTISPECIES: HPF/RaiA family ribosome-associated protein [Cylindrospermopsis]|uniref:HPF/RaiA family ribosome-associated protein n=1 Tax=Cylindrospermopsis TaxID=77021 RepID=UPI00070B3487|nr:MULTISPECIES: HPF/RaiA family ribosome-associated protein [Cylindrospermopsis]KRH96270.1 DNA-binding protein [Cylindrospermopsis sp. CR12]MBU6346030.1 HPF/RaiA family ribosome-associated protein [Cyanobacteria bacterium REEB494]TPX29298.1 HPF/RaiA family ribosome-associated protein [Cylindrospermopsis raciborskii GIHE 2018]UJS04908.1 cold shock domain-containing protein [Cylindrospermopsis raciborskii KLL07]
MKIAPEITYRNLDKSQVIDKLVREKIAKLENICNYINSCHIAIEKSHDRPRSGSPYRVRIDLTVPPGHELVAEKNPGESIRYEPLDAVIRQTFDAMVHQLSKLTQMQRASEQYDRDEETRESRGFITKLFKEDGYGFLQALDGREIYFHKNSVLHQDFNQLKLGACVHFSQEEGEQGPQATTIQLVDKR